MAHVKGKAINVQTGEEVITYFTDEEWAACEKARLDAEAAEAARDMKQEMLDGMPVGFKAFVKAYAKRMGITPAEALADIKAEM